MNEYEKQAKDFLLATNTRLYFYKAKPQTAPLWANKGEKHGIDYVVKLSNNKHEYNFHFWDSVANKESKKMPNNYDFLACLSPLYEKNFSDFCDAFGYSDDSIQAYKTYQACIEQDKNLRLLFTKKQLELLANIK